jgi:hypothetical protein
MPGRNRHLIPFRSPAVLILWADSLFEALLAAACFALGSRLAGWFDLPRELFWLLGGVFAAASVVLGWLARERAIGWLPTAAVANVATGAALWVVAPFAWGSFSPEGRWLVSAVANACLLIGITQWLAWRRP